MSVLRGNFAWAEKMLDPLDDFITFYKAYDDKMTSVYVFAFNWRKITIILFPFS